jgi:hypothetical protein
MSSEDYGLIWLCQSCMLVEANGECGEVHAESCASFNAGTSDEPAEDCDCGAEEPLSAIESGFSVTLGMGADEHDESYCLIGVIAECKSKYADLDWPDVPDSYECDCETDTFSTSQCYGCGSYLYGERYAAHLWKY